MVTLDPEEEFRAGADHLEFRHSDEEQVWARADATHGAIKVKAARPSGGKALATGDDDLD